LRFQVEHVYHCLKFSLTGPLFFKRFHSHSKGFTMDQRLLRPGQHLAFRRRFRGTIYAVAAVLFMLGISLALVRAQDAARKPVQTAVNVLTYHNNAARTGANLAETTLAPSNINYNNFGKLWTFPTDGWVDAQPLYVSNLNMGTQGTHNVLFVATENDTLYAIDANTAAILWQNSLLLPGEVASDDRDCEQIYPVMGITATPVIYLASASKGGILYAVAMSKDSSGNYHQRLHALGLSTGAEQAGSPAEIQATYPSSGPQSSGGIITFSPGQYKSRPALLLVNGLIYIGFSSNCDDPPYSGWIMAYNMSTLAQTTVLNVSPNGQDGALWGSGGGMAADGSGNIYTMVGNGTFDPTLNGNGFPIVGDFGNGFLKLALVSNTLQVVDYFASFDATDGPTDERVELGSSSPLLLPAMTDVNNNTLNLAIGAGKPGTIFVVNRNNMGKFNPTGNNTNAYQQVVGALGPGGDGNDALGAVRMPPVFFNGLVYFGANLDPIEAFQFKNAVLSTEPTTSTAGTFNYPGAALSVSANGSTNGILWVAAPGTPSTGGGLRAYNATNLSQELYSSNAAPGGRDQFTYSKFAPPTIANGMVYVATQTGVVAFGVLP
jgi:PQQ-like domain